MTTLRTENLQLAHPGKNLLRDLSVTFNSGECWAILGPNGCGKTTLLHTVGGLRRPQGGTVILDDINIDDDSRRYLAQQIAVLLQEEQNDFRGTVREYVELGLFAHGTWLRGNADAAIQAHAAMIRMGIDSQADHKWNNLSGGERQRARLAQLLAQAPEVYLLDEPLLHLDLRHQLSVLQCFRDLAQVNRKTVIMVLHDSLWASRFCDHALMLYDDGNCRFGAAQTLVTKNNLAQLYSCSMDSFEFSLPS